jgi:hypothetical protein
MVADSFRWLRGPIRSLNLNLNLNLKKLQIVPDGAPEGIPLGQMVAGNVNGSAKINVLINHNPPIAADSGIPLMT